MSFALDRYSPVAFHAHPELMRAAEAQTAVLSPATPLPTSASAPPAPTPAPPATVAEPIAAYLVGMDATATLRTQLADFLDAAGSRRDVAVNVGVATESGVVWVLRDQVPFRVRAMPRYPAATSTGADIGTALAATGSAAAEDAAGDPHRRQLVVLLWDRPPAPTAPPPNLGAALVLHCVDAVLTPVATNWSGGSWLLARSRPGPRPSLLAHAGRLLDRWEAFATPPPGLLLIPARGGDPP